MATFTELKENKDFIKLDCHRASILLCLEDAKAVLETLPTDKPSLRAFDKLEKKIDAEVDQLEAVDKKIASWYTGKLVWETILLL